MYLKYRCLLGEAKIIQYAECYSKLLKQLHEGMTVNRGVEVSSSPTGFWRLELLSRFLSALKEKAIPISTNRRRAMKTQRNKPLIAMCKSLESRVRQ